MSGKTRNLPASFMTKQDNNQIGAIQIFYHQWIGIALLMAVVIWFVWPDFRSLSQPAPAWYWLVGGSFIIRYLVLWADRRLFGLRRTPYIARRALWRTISPTISLLLIAIGFRELCQHNLFGFGWLFLAGVIVLGAIALRQWAEGWKLRRVRGGSAYKRAQILANLMHVQLNRIYMVPSERGHLTQAFAFGKSIGLSENYSHSLQGAALDFTVGHELAHIRQQHGRLRMLSIPSFYLGASLACFVHPALSPRFRIGFDLIVMLAPILASYHLLRRGEYEADRVAVELIKDPEAAIAALANIHHTAGVPTRQDPVAGLFMTHPSFPHRARAIARAASMPDDLFETVIRETYERLREADKSETN
jgi:Zn-dependent protease with chaperone function